ncbi:Protein SRG1 [Linum perenne]
MSLHGDDPPPRYIVSDIPDLFPPSKPVPVIDLGLLVSGQDDDIREELGKLKAALTSWGCFQVINFYFHLIGHEMSSEFLDRVRSVAKEFFRLPLEEKQKYARPEDDIEGYGNDPILSTEQVLDWSDRLLLKLVPEDSRKVHLWPTNTTEFGEVVGGFSDKVKVIMKELMKAMARCLDLKDDAFLKQYRDKELMVARFNYYPVCSKPEKVLGVKAHSDGSGITVLLQDKEVEGLQMLRDGKWYRVPIIPHALVVNVGDQMEIMSNGIFKSPMHRASASSSKERFSLAVFHLPDPEVEIEPSQQLVTENLPQQYRKLKNYSAINFDCFQRGEIALESVKI